MIQGKPVAAVVVAAGSSTRMGFDKLFFTIEGVEVLRLAVQQLDKHPGVDSHVVVAGANIENVHRLFSRYPPCKPLTIVEGGDSRMASVAAGVAACPNAVLVAIHDGARPFVSQEVISRVLAAAAQDGAAAPALPMKDTVKRARDGLVCETVPREDLWRVQTPQAFDRAAFTRALAALRTEEYAAITDDCMVMEKTGAVVRLVPGEETNRKITTPDDLPMEADIGTSGAPRIGHGYDVHRLESGRPLVLGGVQVPYEKGLMGHSDADVLAHAVMDAMLGAAALGDIGRHFPDSEEAYRGADSIQLLGEVARRCRQAGYTVQNLDATLLCQEPKLAPHIAGMRQNIALAAGIAPGRVSVKATTEEGLGFTGHKQGIAAHCVVLMQHKG